MLDFLTYEFYFNKENYRYEYFLADVYMHDILSKYYARSLFFFLHI